MGWRARRDSNPRPLGPQPNALSTELRAHAVRLAEREGFEPSMQVTPHGGLANRCTRPLCDLSVATAAGILSWASEDPAMADTRGTTSDPATTWAERWPGAIREPTRADGPIHLADYDPAWPALYAREATRIRSLLGDKAR